MGLGCNWKMSTSCGKILPSTTKILACIVVPWWFKYKDPCTVHIFIKEHTPEKKSRLKSLTYKIFDFAHHTVCESESLCMSSLSLPRLCCGLNSKLNTETLLHRTINNLKSKIFDRIISISWKKKWKSVAGGLKTTTVVSEW